MESLTYVINADIPPQAVAELRETVGWDGMEEYYRNPAMTSYLHIGCFDGEKLIGFVDVVSNGVTDAYIQDLIVRPEYQGRGVGTALMNTAINRLKQDRIYMISVLFEERLAPFYKRFGFHVMLAGQMESYPLWNKIRNNHI